MSSSFFLLGAENITDMPKLEACKHTAAVHAALSIPRMVLNFPTLSACHVRSGQA